MSIAVRGRTVAQMIEDIGSVSPDTVFYIGSKSGFFFIGTMDEYKADVDKLSKQIHQYYEDLQVKAKSRLKANVGKSYKINKGELNEKFANRLAMVAKQIKEDLATIDNTTHILDTWRDIPVRKVKSADKKDPLIDPKGIILLVDGPEGGVWFKEEYKGGMKNGTEKD